MLTVLMLSALMLNVNILRSMLTVLMLSALMLNVNILSVVKLSVIMLNFVIVLNVNMLCIVRCYAECHSLCRMSLGVFMLNTKCR
jgi:hypothetical protein